MSVVLCPNCKGKGFYWSLDDDNCTHWRCALCGFCADEDESKDKACAVCGKKSAVWLTHGGRAYYWCVLCGSYQDQAA